MARVINQNNEVIATKSTKETKTKSKATISKTSLIVGIVLFLAALAVAIILIVVFTKKKNEENTHVPTQLEQAITDYQKRTNTDYKIKLLTGLQYQEVEQFKGECYVIVYDTTWMENASKETKAGSKASEYDNLAKLDSYLVGDSTTKSFLKAIENCNADIRLFVIDYSTIKVDEGSQDSTGENAPHFTTAAGERRDIKISPEIYHVNFEKVIDKETGETEHKNVERLYSETEGKMYKLWNVISSETNALNQLSKKA